MLVESVHQQHSGGACPAPGGDTPRGRGAMQRERGGSAPRLKPPGEALTPRNLVGASPPNRRYCTEAAVQSRPSITGSGTGSQGLRAVTGSASWGAS